jgi:spore coat polysaccharide biosynthesis protein SpsF (cytidylyltransferase family)
VKYVVLIQSRLNSSRLPGKAMLSVFGYPLVVTCAKRVQKFGELIVCTSNHKSDDIICDTLKHHDIPYFRGSLNNVLKRFYDATLSLNDEDVIIRLTADNPIPDHNFLEDMKLVWEKRDCEYLSSESPNNNLPKGLSAEFFKCKSLRDAYKNATSEHDKEHVTPYIKRIVDNHYLSDDFLKTIVKNSYSIDTLDDYIRVSLLLPLASKDTLSIRYDKLLT